MAPVASSEAAVAEHTGDVRAGFPREESATAAWLCALPCAAIAALVVLTLGPPLGALLAPDRPPYTFLPGFAKAVHPEPTEHARYLIAVCAPFLMVLGISTAPRWRPRVPDRFVDAAALAAQVVLVGVVVASLVAQYRMHFGEIYTAGGQDPNLTVHYFTVRTLAFAALVVMVIAGVLRTPALLAKAIVVLQPGSRRRARIAGTLAVAATALWLLHAVHTDAEIGNAVEDVRYHLGFTLDETFAVLNGRTPLVDFSAQYASLLPYVLALPMLVAGKTVLTFTLAACTLTGLALLAIYGVLRRATRSAVAALVLYLPFLATSLFQIWGTLENRSSVASYYASFPLRYALPFLLAWLTARRLERGGGFASAWLLFVVGGLAMLNNLDFGLAAVVASAAALTWTGPRPLAGSFLLRLGGALVAGLVTAIALVTLLTLARAGDVPQPGRLVEYARTYGVGGFSLMPIPGVLGVHLPMYLTYVAAIAVATVRARRGAENRVLTGMLAWAGIFGLGAGMYWVGRSHPDALKQEFSAWALALVLLTVPAVRELASARSWRRAGIGACVALFGFGVAACSLAQTPTPWSQIERLGAPFAPSEEAPLPNPLAPPADPGMRRFVASLADGRSRFVVRRGAPVAILLTTGHRVADAYGVVNVSPYTGVESIVTVERVDAVLDALRDAGGNTLILPTRLELSIFPLLAQRGFEPLTLTGLRPWIAGRTAYADRAWPDGGGVMKWVDTRNLRPRALR